MTDSMSPQQARPAGTQIRVWQWGPMRLAWLACRRRLSKQQPQSCNLRTMRSPQMKLQGEQHQSRYMANASKRVCRHCSLIKHSAVQVYVETNYSFGVFAIVLTADDITPELLGEQLGLDYKTLVYLPFAGQSHPVQSTISREELHRWMAEVRAHSCCCHQCAACDACSTRYAYLSDR